MGNTTMFKQFLVLLLVVSVALAGKKGKGGKKPGKGKGEMGKPEPEGLCLEPDMIMKMCVMGSPFGKKKPSKGKGKKPSKCPSIEDIAEEVAKEMSDEICIFQELGWMDADWNEDEAMYMADIASLPSNVSAALDSDDDFEECYMEVEACMNEKFNKDKKMKACYKKMSDEDKAKLEEIGEFIAGTVCFKKNFMKACTGEVKSKMAQKMEEMMGQVTTMAG